MVDVDGVRLVLLLDLHGNHLGAGAGSTRALRPGVGFLALSAENGFFIALSWPVGPPSGKTFPLRPASEARGNNLIVRGREKSPASLTVTEEEGRSSGGGRRTLASRFVREAGTGLVRQFSAIDVFTWSIIFFPWLTSWAGIFWVTPDYYQNVNYYASLAVWAVIAVVIVLLYWQLTSVMPRSGGDYVFISRVLSSPSGSSRASSSSLPSSSRPGRVVLGVLRGRDAAVLRRAGPRRQGHRPSGTSSPRGSRARRDADGGRDRHPRDRGGAGDSGREALQAGGLLFLRLRRLHDAAGHGHLPHEQPRGLRQRLQRLLPGRRHQGLLGRSQRARILSRREPRQPGRGGPAALRQHRPLSGDAVRGRGDRRPRTSLLYGLVLAEAASIAIWFGLTYMLDKVIGLPFIEAWAIQNGGGGSPLSTVPTAFATVLNPSSLLLWLIVMASSSGTSGGRG